MLTSLELFVPQGIILFESTTHRGVARMRHLRPSPQPKISCRSSVRAAMPRGIAAYNFLQCRAAVPRGIAACQILTLMENPVSRTLGQNRSIYYCTIICICTSRGVARVRHMGPRPQPGNSFPRPNQCFFNAGRHCRTKT